MGIAPNWCAACWNSWTSKKGDPVMDRDTYMILRVTGIEDGASDPFRVPGWKSDSSLESTREIEYRVEAQTLDQQDYGEVRRDGQVAAIARPMPLQRIPPNGAASLSVSGSLIQKVPALMFSMARIASSRLLV